MSQYSDFHERHRETAARVARREHRKAPSFTVDDMEQAIWEHVGEKLPLYLGQDDNTIESFMSKAAKQYWSKERQSFMYFTGSFIYTPAHTRRALETCAWSVLEECPDIEARLDVREAFEKLGALQAQMVFRRYGLKESLEDFNTTEKRNLYKGIDNMTHRLNDGLRKVALNTELIGETV